MHYANTLLKDRALFGSDYPLITPEPGILKSNAVRLLRL